MYGFSWEVLNFDNVSYDVRCEVLKLTISTSHFMVCFEHLAKKYQFMACFEGDGS